MLSAVFFTDHCERQVPPSLQANKHNFHPNYFHGYFQRSTFCRKESDYFFYIYRKTLQKFPCTSTCMFYLASNESAEMLDEKLLK